VLLQRVRVDHASAAAGNAPPLARVRFGTMRDASPESLPPDGTLDIHVPLQRLGPGPAWFDRFVARGPVRRERLGDVDFASDDRALVGCVRLDESRAGGLRAAARHAYGSIFAVLDRSACRIPLRFWNYVPHINASLDGLERYRHFNIGRQEAFLAAGRAAFTGAPAACALGSFADELVVYFLATRATPVAIENPRQVSAYDYPADYGPRSPTFSRATLLAGTRPNLFISGTASIVGHRSQHPGNVAAQTHETFVNLRAVIDAANQRIERASFGIDGLAYTVYVRQQTDLDVIRACFEQEVGADSDAARDALFLAADVCRAELLVEIEATGRAA
jgi:enamine deaminase RidA (YjgF/YER057c/UK114 family)